MGGLIEPKGSIVEKKKRLELGTIWSGLFGTQCFDPASPSSPF